jgi:hypothetical protein
VTKLLIATIKPLIAPIKCLCITIKYLIATTRPLSVKIKRLIAIIECLIATIEPLIFNNTLVQASHLE